MLSQKLLAGCARSPTPSRKHYNAKSGFRRHESGIGVKPKIIPWVLTCWILRRLQFAAVRPAYTQVKRCAHLAEVMTHDQHFSVLFPIGAGEPAQHLGSRRAVCIAIFDQAGDRAGNQVDPGNFRLQACTVRLLGIAHTDLYRDIFTGTDQKFIAQSGTLPARTRTGHLVIHRRNKVTGGHEDPAMAQSVHDIGMVTASQYIGLGIFARPKIAAAFTPMTVRIRRRCNPPATALCKKRIPHSTKARRLINFEESWSRFDPMVNLSVDVTPDVHVYGKWSTGYRSGGANSRSLTYAAVNPEEVSIFEGGIKTEFFNRRARFNLTGYVGTYKNVQMEFSGPYYNLDANGNPVGVTTRTTSDTVNVPGTGRVRGIEAELNLVPAPGLTLAANYAYVYVRLPDALNPFPTFKPGVGMVYNPALPSNQIYTPEHALGGQIDYEVPVGNVMLRAHLDASWDSGMYNSLTYSGAAQKIKSESAVVFNGRIGIGDISLGSSGAKMTVSLWGRNLFNAEYLYNRSLSTTTGLSGTFNEPRTFGIEGRIKL